MKDLALKLTIGIAILMTALSCTPPDRGSDIVFPAYHKDTEVLLKVEDDAGLPHLTDELIRSLVIENNETGGDRTPYRIISIGEVSYISFLAPLPISLAEKSPHDFQTLKSHFSIIYKRQRIPMVATMTFDGRPMPEGVIANRSVALQSIDVDGRRYDREKSYPIIITLRLNATKERLSILK